MNDDEIIKFCFKLHISISDSTNYDTYDNDYISYFSSPIINEKIDENSEIIESNEIGKIELIYLHGNRAFDNDLDIVDICDAEYQELYDYVRYIYHNGLISEKLNDSATSNDILILDKISIDKLYQGKELGLIISRKMIDFFGNSCGGIVIKPFPLQFSIGYPDKEKFDTKFISEKFSDNFEIGRKKILNYWKKLSKNCKTIKINKSETIIYIPK